MAEEIGTYLQHLEYLDFEGGYQTVAEK